MAEDPYIPEEQTALGPSAKVYRAHDVHSGHTVRLKVLLTDHESPFAFDREHLARRLAGLKQIHHPRVARLIELDVQEQDMTLVSEFGEGLNGWEWARRRPLVEAEIRILAAQLMSALQAGEALKLPHGDLKPANLIIENHPMFGLRLVIQDWGIARSRHEQPRETLRFRAPELGPDDEPTARGDLFSAAATLVTLITGKVIVEEVSPGQRQAAWALFKASRLHSLCPGLDPVLQGWLAWLLNPDPRLRPASAKLALAALNGNTESSALGPAQAPWWAGVLIVGYNLGMFTLLAAYLRWLFQRGQAG